MRNLLFLFCLLFPFFTFAQSYQALKRQGDSLRYYHKFKEAVTDYDSCINMVLTGKQKVYDEEWDNLLSSAIETNKVNPVKYANLRFGTRAEKMSDKIVTLKEMGVKYLFSFYTRTGGTSFSINLSPYGCQIYYGATYILVWGINNDVFMQEFNACTTYKPVKMNDKVLFDLLNKHVKDMIKEKIKPMILKGNDGIPQYHFEFYVGETSIKKDMVDPLDFRTMEQNISSDEIRFVKKTTIDKGNEIYQYNIKTYFAQLFLRVNEDEAKYYDTINSGAERARVGNFE
ncbi:MAG: hypothetical protein JWR50_2864 [Mucilaginibacter sp.]|nr:hypothetical protein [Mucilaginibacter sp.]